MVVTCEFVEGMGGLECKLGSRGDDVPFLGLGKEEIPETGRQELTEP